MGEQMQNSPRGIISGSTLKWIAIITMLIDHAAVVLLIGWARYRHGWGSGIESQAFYSAMRSIGRLAFPIFCFLLAEGFSHTKNPWKYLLRLSLFALISELPFDLAFQNTLQGRCWIEFSGQNVFFTLALGLLAILLWKQLMHSRMIQSPTLRAGAAAACVLMLCLTARFLHTDYGALGVALIVAFWLLREQPWLRDLCGLGILAAMILFGSHWIELLGALSFILFHLYNGERGHQPKYFFYIFYPVHLLLLVLLRYLLFSL